jgi:cytochrome c2
MSACAVCGPFGRAFGLMAVVALSSALSGCGGGLKASVRAIGDPDRGAQLVTDAGCSSCHLIPGQAAGIGLVGPPLAAIGSRTVIAGRLANTPPNMISWLQHPQAFAPGGVMPDMGLTPQQARDITAYLYTLQ